MWRTHPGSMAVIRNIRDESHLQKPLLRRVLPDLSLLLIIGIVVTVALFWNKRKTGEFLVSKGPAPLSVRTAPRNVRFPTVAGQFYPDDEEELYGTVERLMNSSSSVGIRGVRAVLVPHAGYVFSAEVAAASFREVDSRFRRVFILAANHNSQADFSGVSFPAETHYAIPGAEVPLSSVVDDMLIDPLFTSEPLAHTMHMIELELPFLHFLRRLPDQPDFAIVPMILGRMDLEQIEHLAAILEYYADHETLFVFSVDLSHYFPGDQARQLDTYSIQSILSRDTDGLTRATTDGNQVLLTMVALAIRNGWEPTFLMYRNSGDASGDYSQVVGYGSVVFSDPIYLTEEERNDLLGFARDVVGEYVRSGNTLQPDEDMISRHPVFQIPRGVFVTLNKEGMLRGCIGHIIPTGPLHIAVRTCAIQAASSDPRFPPVKVDELQQLSFSISILDFPTPVRAQEQEDFLDILQPMNDGVILSYRGKQSTFLPYVWREIPDPVEFLSRLCEKQNSPRDCWTDSLTVLHSFRAYEFGEE